MIVPLLSISPCTLPISRTAPSVLSVPSNVVCSPIRLSTSPLSTTLRVSRPDGRPTFTSPCDGRKLGPAVAPDAGAGVPVAAVLLVSVMSAVAAEAPASSRSFDRAPRNRVHSCSSDFLNMWLLQRGYAPATQYRRAHDRHRNPWRALSHARRAFSNHRGCATACARPIPRQLHD